MKESRTGKLHFKRYERDS